MNDNRSITPVNLSGSRVAAVLGLHKYLTPAKLAAEIIESRNPGYCEKNGIELPEFEINKSIEFGWDFESEVLNLIHNRYGYIYDQQGFYERGNRTCHIDARLSKEKIVEVKTVSASAYYTGWNEKTGEIPNHYYAQVQHNMDLTGAKQCLVAALVFPKNPEEIAKNLDGEEPDTWKQKIKMREITVALAQMGYYQEYLIERDDKFIALMNESCDIFWEKYIETETIPPATYSDDFKILCPQPHWECIADNAVEDLCVEYAKTNSELDILDKRKNQIRTIIFNYMFFNKDRNELGERTMRLFSQTGKSIASWNGKTFRVNVK